jgi:hypothetical protein
MPHSAGEVGCTQDKPSSALRCGGNNLDRLPFCARSFKILDHGRGSEKAWLALLGLLEIFERFGTVREPAGAKVIAFPAATPQSQKSGSYLIPAFNRLRQEQSG